MIVDINYYEKGKQVTRSIEINFVSNWVVKQYNETIKQALESYEAALEIRKMSEEIIKVKEEQPKDWKNKIEMSNEKLEKLSKQIRDVEDSGFFKKRYEIVKELLIKNGISENDKLCTYDFWDKDVSPKELYNFLNIVIEDEYKDAKPQKKNT